ncbi:MAG TPA: preprotein translocase subunit SecG [Bordetella sp.]
MSYTTILLVVQFLTALAIIILVLLQQGKGADMGSSFGSGSAGSLFGASGAANFLSRTTKWAAVVFFASTIGLAYASHSIKAGGTPIDSGVMQGFGAAAPKGDAVPAANGTAATPAAPGADAAKGDASIPNVPAAPAK